MLVANVADTPRSVARFERMGRKAIGPSGVISGQPVAREMELYYFIINFGGPILGAENRSFFIIG